MPTARNTNIRNQNVRSRSAGNASRTNNMRSSSSRRNRNNRRNNPTVIPMILIGILICAIIVTASLLLSHSGKVYSNCLAEAGTTVSAENFLKDPSQSAEFAENSPAVNYNVPGDYPVIVKAGNFTYRCTVTIQDTVIPVVTCQNLQIMQGSSVSPEDFITSVQDATATTVTFAAEPDVTLCGEQNVTLRVTDLGGNTAFCEATLTVTPLVVDTTAPVISGVKDLTLYLGETISYKNGVTVTDDLDPNPTLSVDTGNVNIKAPGSYPVTYVAQDSAGNKTEKTITVTILQRLYSEDMVYSLVRPILDEIIPAGMSQRDKLTAIYQWIQSNISYAESKEKEDWTKAAYEGLTNRRGDCYVYASVAKAFLNCANIKNMDIHRIPTSYSHYWNLVDIGDGWYHFDTTPRAVRPRPNFCYVDDATITEFSNAHDKCHNYDRTIFTDIN